MPIGIITRTITIEIAPKIRGNRAFFSPKKLAIIVSVERPHEPNTTYSHRTTCCNGREKAYNRGKTNTAEFAISPMNVLISCLEAYDGFIFANCHQAAIIEPIATTNNITNKLSDPDISYRSSDDVLEEQVMRKGCESQWYCPNE
jgi:hypothetical protein